LLLADGKLGEAYAGLADANKRTTQSNQTKLAVAQQANQTRIELAKLASQTKVQVAGLDNNTRVAIAQVADTLKARELALKYPGGHTPTKPLTTSENNASSVLLGQAIAALGKGISPQALQAGAGRLPIAEKKTNSYGQTVNGTAYEAVKPVPSVLVQAAQQLIATGAVTPPVAALMHGMGMRGTTYNGKLIKVRAAAPAPVTGPLASGLGPLTPTNNGTNPLLG
jgi:hypothetical protein